MYASDTHPLSGGDEQSDFRRIDGICHGGSAVVGFSSMARAAFDADGQRAALVLSGPSSIPSGVHKAAFLFLPLKFSCQTLLSYQGFPFLHSLLS